MQIDRQALDKMLSLNDRQLKAILLRLAAEGGINPSDFNINPENMESIRHALRTATDADLTRIAEQYEANRQKRR